MRKVEVFYDNRSAGILEENDQGFRFHYHRDYLNGDNPPISVTLPLQEDPFLSDRLFPFFDGLIPEGWLLAITERNWKINSRDRMGLLMVCCRDCIGAVSLLPLREGSYE